MRRWLRVGIFLLIMAIFEGGLLARGVCHQLLNFSLEAPVTTPALIDERLKMLDKVQKITFYVQWIPRSVQDSQLAYGRKLARKWTLRR